MFGDLFKSYDSDGEEIKNMRLIFERKTLKMYFLREQF